MQYDCEERGLDRQVRVRERGAETDQDPNEQEGLDPEGAKHWRVIGSALGSSATALCHGYTI